MLLFVSLNFVWYIYSPRAYSHPSMRSDDVCMKIYSRREFIHRLRVYQATSFSQIKIISLPVQLKTIGTDFLEIQHDALRQPQYTQNYSSDRYFLCPWQRIENPRNKLNNLDSMYAVFVMWAKATRLCGFNSLSCIKILVGHSQLLSTFCSLSVNYCIKNNNCLELFVTFDFL